jgi:hypothetical protein
MNGSVINSNTLDCQRFSRLPLNIQLNVIIEEGIYLTHRVTSQFILRLFELENFYVEITTLKDKGKVISIKAFRDTEKLEPYLAAIDISSCFEW